MNWRALIGLDEAPSSAASQLAKHGATLRKDRQREKVRARLIQLCAETGQPVPDAWR